AGAFLTGPEQSVDRLDYNLTVESDRADP
ncbi:MAG: hypothetical protein QOD87_761, partial [Pseudonocardiales bacterium]|nr:hypothetical protein [Pseudonocardiales bacterium]